MADEQHIASLECNVAHLAKAFVSESCSTDRKDSIYQQNFRIEMGSDSKRQTHLHTALVELHEHATGLIDFGKPAILFDLFRNKKNRMGILGAMTVPLF